MEPDLLISGLLELVLQRLGLGGLKLLEVHERWSGSRVRSFLNFAFLGRQLWINENGSRAREYGVITCDIGRYAPSLHVSFVN